MRTSKKKSTGKPSRRNKKKEELYISELFTGYLPMAWKHAGKFAATYGLPFGEVKDEAEGALGMLCANWFEERLRKPENGERVYASPTTWINKKLFFHLLTFCTRKQPREMTYTDPQAERFKAPERWYDRLCRVLSTDARVVVQTILFGPAELMDELMPRPTKTASPEVARAAVHSMLDWEEVRFEEAWMEIKEAL